METGKFVLAHIFLGRVRALQEAKKKYAKCGTDPFSGLFPAPRQAQKLSGATFNA